MPNLRERIEEILEYYLFTNPNPRKKDVSQATDQILQVFDEVLPKEQEKWIGVTAKVEGKIEGFNSYLAKIRENIDGKI